MSPLTRASRIKGSIFGIAIVDALGGPVEFHKRGTFPEVTGYRHNANFNVPPGTWTDDTSMTLCLAKALIDRKGEYVPQAALRNYIRWWKEGYLSAVGYCFDIGTATGISLGIWKRFLDKEDQNGPKDDPKALYDKQFEVDKLLKHERSCGNGSLMRVAPVGLVYSHDVRQAVSVAETSSRVTHPYKRCRECCKLYTILIVCAMNGSTKEELARKFADIGFVDDSVNQRFKNYSSITDWQAIEARKIDSSGYVLSTLEAALWSFFTTTSFAEGALKVVNLGDDADTVGAVYGGLAGAFYGFESIPTEWIDGLQEKAPIQRIANGLISL